MSRAPLRDDLALAAYAVMLGYELRGYLDVDLKTAGASALFAEDGIPGDGLQFKLGDINVWFTARGWRVGRLVEGRYEKPGDADFHHKLKAALDEGVRNWRDR